jgi:type II secretion system protein G
MRKNIKGFTLIELLVVIAIIGLLSTLAVVALSSARAKARDAKRVSDIKQITSALELYFNDKNSYPVVDTAITLGSASDKVLCDTAAGFQADTTGCTTTYMGQVPANPDPNGSIYLYTGSESDYSIGFTLEGTTGGLAAGAHTANPNGIQ